MNEKPRRGRPVSGRKIVVQIGLDEDEYERLQEIAGDNGQTISAMGRKLLTDAIEKGRKRR